MRPAVKKVVRAAAVALILALIPVGFAHSGAEGAAVGFNNACADGGQCCFEPASVCLIDGQVNRQHHYVAAPFCGG